MAATEIYTLSLHDALPISKRCSGCRIIERRSITSNSGAWYVALLTKRSEEHTSELQSRGHLVCRLLLEKKNQHQHRALQGVSHHAVEVEADQLLEHMISHH